MSQILGLILGTHPFEAPVIPAKLVLREGGGAGIHVASPRKWPVYGLDSRFRGNDRTS
jgi:hypothetical protein